MPPETDPTVDPSDPTPQEPVHTTPTRTSTPTNEPSDPKAQVLTQADIDAAREKARKDEKSKLYPEIEKNKRAALEAQEKAEALEQELAKTQQQLSELRAGKSDEMASVSAEIQSLTEKLKKTEIAMERLADASASRIRQSELAAYRQSKIAEAKLDLFAELVVGDSEEAIDESIVVARKKEEATKEKARADARKELGANVPTPRAPTSGNHGDPPVSAARDRERIARLKGPDYQKARQELLQKAREEAGLI